MLFRRKKPAAFWEKMRITFFPRHSYGRSIKYLQKRILRLNATPHAIAAGLAAGVFVSFTPFIGVHFFLAFVIAYVVAGNMLAAAAGTFIGNPLTFPIIWSASLEIGKVILKGRFDDLDDIEISHVEPKEFSYLDIVNIWDPLIKPMLVGGIPLGLLAAIPIYILARWSIIKYRAARSAKINRRAAIKGQASQA